MTKQAFVCGTCGQSHDGFPTDQGWKLPDDVWAIPEPGRAQKAKFDTDRCQLGDRYFIRCILYVPFSQRDGEFGWGVWVEVTDDDFFRYVAVYTQDARGESPAHGTLANVISSYEDSAAERVTIQFGTSTERPKVHTLPDSQTSLAREQRNGMDAARYHHVLHDIGAL